MNDSATARFWRVLPVWIFASLLVTIWHYHFHRTIIVFPRYSVIARRFAWLFVLGVIIVGVLLYVVALAAMPGYDLAFTAWRVSLVQVFPVALLIALVIFFIRAFAFLFRIIPIIGSFLHAAVSTFAVVWTMQQYGWVMSGTAPIGLSGSDGMITPIAIVAAIALFLVWRARGAEKNADAVEPPALVLDQRPKTEDRGQYSTQLTESGAILASSTIRVEVTRTPFGVVVKNEQSETLWQLAENGLSRDWLIQKIIAIPLLYTGNTIKMNLGAIKTTSQSSRKNRGGR